MILIHTEGFRKGLGLTDENTVEFCLVVLIHLGHLCLLFVIFHFQSFDLGKSLSYKPSCLLTFDIRLYILLSFDLKLLQILIHNPCLGLSSNLHLPLVHILLVLAANFVNSLIGGKALLAAVVLGQAA